MKFFKLLIMTVMSILVIALVSLCIIGYILFPPPPPSAIVFDIPALVYKNIDEVRLVLGKPNHKELEPMDKAAKEWSNTYHKDGFRLTIRFNPSSRSINQYMLLVDGRGSYENLEDMLRIGNLHSSNATYNIETEPIERNAFSYVIIKINK